MIYRTSVYVTVLPTTCTIVVFEAASLHYCGGSYYHSFGKQYVVVNGNWLIIDICQSADRLPCRRLFHYLHFRRSPRAVERCFGGPIDAQVR
jgi:hypothetical protein